MASEVSTDKLRSNVFHKLFDFDPDGTDPVNVSWIDFSLFAALLVAFFRTVGTGNVDKFRIVAGDKADGSGTVVVVKEHALGSQPNAVGDQIFLECRASEIAALGSNLRYVSAQVEFATGTDEGVVSYLAADPRFARPGLTADIVA